VKFNGLAISVAAYARQLGVHARTVRRWIQEGRALPGTLGCTRTLGGHVRIWIPRKSDEPAKRA